MNKRGSWRTIQNSVLDVDILAHFSVTWKRWTSKSFPNDQIRSPRLYSWTSVFMQYSLLPFFCNFTRTVLWLLITIDTLLRTLGRLNSRQPNRARTSGIRSFMKFVLFFTVLLKFGVILHKLQKKAARLVILRRKFNFTIHQHERNFNRGGLKL